MAEPIELETEAGRLRTEGKHAEAVEKLEEALAIDPGFVRAHLALAVTYHQMKEYEKSVEHGEKACEVEPNDPFNFTALSVTYQRAFAGTNDPKFIQLAEEAKAKADMMGQG